MSSTVRLTCPQCAFQVRVPSRYCPECHFDLIAAANEISHPAELAGDDEVLTVEALVPRLGEYLVAAGVIADEQLAYALRIQQDRQMAGERILIGQVLVNLGFIDRVALDRFVARQIIEYKTALEENNRQLEARVQQRTHELEATLEKLSELNRLKANLVATVSHELLGPLQIILGHTELMARGSLGPLAPRQTRSLQAVRSATGELHALISELLQFGSAVSGQLPLSFRPITLATAVQSAVDQLRPRAEEADISLRTQMAANIPPVRADSEKIAWVIGQFVDNAIKFTPPGGEVVVSTLMKDSGVIVTVRDSGIGIPAESHREIFEPLHQLDNSLTRRYGGVGLGLSLAECIVEAHQSHIEVESASNAGSRFSFRLATATA